MPEFPDQAAPDPDNPVPSNDSISLGLYGVAGMWGLSNTGLVIEVRDIQEWPFRNVAYDSCGDGRHVFGVAGSQLAVNGWLYRHDGQWLLRTESGVVYVHPGFNASDLNSATEAIDADIVSPDVASGPHQVVVIGPWKTDGSELHMEAERFIRIKTVCDDPQPPRPPILPGEIAALGTLEFEDGRPYLQTPQGRIALLTVTDGETEPQPVPGDALMEIVPQITDADIDSAASGEDAARPVRHILVVGKWQVSASGQLTIVVRYALPWPYPYTDSPDPGAERPSLPPVEVLPVDPTVVVTAVAGGTTIEVTPISVDAIEIRPSDNDETDRRSEANAK